jgi:hypothetical protein
VPPLPPPAAAPAAAQEEQMTLKVRPDVADRVARYARIPLGADLAVLGEKDRQALHELRQAADLMGELAFRQTWSGNPALREQVAKLTGPEAQAARDLFRIMGGPWDRRDDYLPFVGETPHPKGSAFYPEDLAADELTAWIDAHADQAEALKGYFTVVERREGGLAAVPYSEAYRELLGPAAEALRAAAALTEVPSLRTYLESRAAALLSNEYYQSDIDWLMLEGPLEVVVGPYETYDDGLMGYKASFEAFLCVVDPGESAKLDKFKGEIAFLQSSLPLPEEHRATRRGDVVPIKVVDEIYATGQGGVMTIAFNLPNDERVRQDKGFKNVLLRNVMQAKYDAILLPIAERALPPDMATSLAFEPFFNSVLFHEISHGLGPGRITKEGRETEVRAELREMYSTIEEAKADVLSVWAQKILADKGLIDEAALAALPQTFVAGIFRTSRFGISEAHGQGVLVQVNYLLERGAIAVAEDGRFAPVPDRFFGAVTELARDLLTIQALGDYEAAKAFADRYGKVVPPAMEALIGTLGAGIPVDIDPVYPDF